MSINITLAERLTLGFMLNPTPVRILSVRSMLSDLVCLGKINYNFIL